MAFYLIDSRMQTWKPECQYSFSVHKVLPHGKCKVILDLKVHDYEPLNQH